eukprot:TRINITY_DN123082_c0_g1_i1.p1 TRINITY_DN123082_c0_g1~~TRINITY_DN123082_c0_g1_i1.p1  ORF type:complete len:564 (+),score=78.69 TRINITY_DN123082_c0_g1_i1:107-1798(+)
MKRCLPGGEQAGLQQAAAEEVDGECDDINHSQARRSKRSQRDDPAGMVRARPQVRRPFDHIDKFEDWPSVLLDLLAGGQNGALLKQRVEANLQGGLHLYTDYSGSFSIETALRMLQHAMPQNGFQVPAEWLRCPRACDISRESRRLALQSEHRPEHMFSSLQGMMSEETRTVLKNLRPHAQADEESKEMCYEQMWDFVMGREEELACGATSSNCVLHPGDSCPVVCLDSRSPPRVLLGEVASPMTCNWSGPLCDSFSRIGRRQGLVSPTFEPYAVYAAGLNAQGLHLNVLENPPGFDVDDWMARTGFGRKAVSVKFGPTELGYPVLRHRLLVASWDDHAYTWAGDTVLSNKEASTDVTTEFMKIFRCDSTLDGSDFCGLAPQQERESLYKHLAGRRGIRGLANDAPFSSLAVEDILPVSSKRFYQTLRNEWMETSPQIPGQPSVGPPVVGDVTNCPELFQGRHGRLLPSLTTTCLLCCIDKDALFTMSELRYAYGWPSLSPSGQNKYAQFLPAFSDALPANRVLLGESQHLPCMAAFFLFVLSHIEKRAVDADEFDLLARGST